MRAVIVSEEITLLSESNSHISLEKLAIDKLDHELITKLKKYGVWDIFLTLLKNDALSNRELFFDNLLKAINFSKSVFGDNVDSMVDERAENDANSSDLSLFSQGRR